MGGTVITLFTRLKHELYPSAQLAAASVDQFRCTQQHGGMCVMTTHMCRTGKLAFKGKRIFLGQRQRIHICPQKQRGARAAALN